MNATTTLQAIRFYKANGTFGFLSNLYKRSMTLGGRVFPTAEHAYQYGKFSDQAAADWAMQAPSAHLVAIVAHGLFAWDVTEGWAAIKVDRMRQVLLAKFTQHEDLKKRLLDTGDAHLVEDSKTDAFWGNGTDTNRVDRHHHRHLDRHHRHHRPDTRHLGRHLAHF